MPQKPELAVWVGRTLGRGSEFVAELAAAGFPNLAALRAGFEALPAVRPPLNSSEFKRHVQCQPKGKKHHGKLRPNDNIDNQHHHHHCHNIA